MTDKELLEYAAKAVGYKIDKSATNGGGVNNEGFDLRGNAVLDWHNDVVWNPLTDNGDAFRLAVKLGIHITNAEGYAWASALQHDATEPIRVDAYAATRCAIVRVAAAIGKQL